MGQTTHGILYGVWAGSDDRWLGDDGDSGIIGDYKAYCKPDIDSAANRLGLAPWNIERRFVPDAEWVGDDGGRYLGFWIQRGASECGMNGAVQMSRSAVKEKWPREYKNARIRWRRFAKWCEETRCAVVGVPRLWLLETEVA